LNILPYTSNVAPDLAQTYNAMVRPIPHCYPVSAERLDATLSATDPGDAPPYHGEQAFVAIENASVLGFVHTAVGPIRRDDPEERGLIRFLGVLPGQRVVGQALLAQAEACLRGQGMDEVVAFDQHTRYPFYHLPSAYLSDRLGHVAALLGWNGYTRIAGEVYMDWIDYPEIEPAPAGIPAEVSVEWCPGKAARPGVNVHARQGDKPLGVCMCISAAEGSAAGEYAGAPEAQDWAFTEWLGVEREAQGKGLGRHLLQRALLELRGAGYRHAAISTARDNYRAALFYSNLGYQVLDWTYGYGRRME
jgi:GNAT superfamily N-acetyltransferase